jgi:hypothetical protein
VGGVFGVTGVHPRWAVNNLATVAPLLGCAGQSVVVSCTLVYVIYIGWMLILQHQHQVSWSQC